MKNITPIVLAVLCCLVAINGFSLNKLSTDTVVAVTGKVMDKENMGPLKAIVEYKRLPYGNEVGKISSNENGEFTIYVHGDASYSINVVSEGYFAHYEEFNVSHELSTQTNISREIILESGDVGYVFTLENLNFELGESEIAASSYRELDMVVARLNQFPAMEIQLEGHTDFRGNEDLNMELSRDRVTSVKKYITDKGIQEFRIKTKAYGGTQPLTREDNEEAHASNRRVEVRILKVE